MGENEELQVEQIDSKTMCLIDRNSEALNTNQEKTLKRPFTAKTTEQRPSNRPSDPKKSRFAAVPTSFKWMCKDRPKGATTSFIHGNYGRYYGYRNSNDFKDIRLETFAKHRSFFEGNNVLDIGCNNGLVTISVARDFHVKRIVGIDIDKRLVDRARQFLLNEKKSVLKCLR